MIEISPTDSILSFAIPAKNCRGRVVRLGPALDDILAAHDYPAVIRDILAEAVCLTAMLGALLKDESAQLTLQAQTETGVINLLACDYKDGALRGYVDFDRERLAAQPVEPSLMALFGKGYLAITFDVPKRGGRYQGIVPLEGESLADAAEHYFFQSEQIPSVIRIATRHEPGEGCYAAGLLLQHLPEGEVGRERLHVRHDHPEWEHAQALAVTLKDEELTNTSLPLSDIVWRLFHEEEEVRATDPTPLAKGCRCDLSHIRDVIGRFSPDDRAEMADEQGIIGVDCAFCSRLFPLRVDSFA